MHCRWARRKLDRYLDSDLGPVDEALLRFHLRRCESCLDLYERSDPLLGVLASSPKPQPPSRLEIKILSALSIEALRRERPAMRWSRAWLKLGNLLQPVAVPAVGGLLLALILVPALLSAFWTAPVAYASDDVPLRFLATPLVTAPAMVLPSPYPVVRDFTVVAYIDMRGGVYDYRILSDELLDSRSHARVANALLTSKFEPASLFGQPTLGQRVIVYQRIDTRA